MDQPNRKQSIIQDTEQHILNNSFDPEFGILSFQMLGQNGTDLKRLQTDADGNLKADPELLAALGGGDASSGYGTNQIIEVGNVSYFLKSNTSGDYLVKKVDFDTGITGWATILNNPTITTYTDAETNYATLIYGRKDQAF